ncbi:MAG: hypothetical protein ACE5GB_04885 [Acidimicrobiales bacterium]
MAALVAVASSCGGGGSGADPAGDPAPRQSVDQESEVVPSGSTALGVADALVAAHGDTGGFVASVSAMERGYDIDQMVAASLESRIDSDGVISAVGGGREAPEGRPLGLIEVAEPEGEVSGGGIVLASCSGGPGPRLIAGSPPRAFSASFRPPSVGPSIPSSTRAGPSSL